MTTKRGRKSAAAMTVVTAMPERPRPPATLIEPERLVWNAVVNSHPGGWITKDAHPILNQYCRHVVRAERCAQLIGEVESSADFDAATWKELLEIQRKETATILGLARSMRLTHQSRYRPDSSKALPQSDARKPWE